MKNIKDRIIWIFREPRSGSTSAVDVICNKLNRTYHFIDHDFKNPEIFHLKKIPSFFQKEGDNQKLFHTHYFPALLSMVNYINPILIRISRKNVIEQCLSRIATDLMNWKFTNLRKNDDTGKEIFDDFCKSKIEITKDQVDFYIKRRLQQNILWNNISHNYENQTIYYEDMCHSIDIPVLGLYNVDLTTETIKLPNYKENVFTNYDLVKKWLSEYKL